MTHDQLKEIKHEYMKLCEYKCDIHDYCDDQFTISIKDDNIQFGEGIRCPQCERNQKINEITND